MRNLTQILKEAKESIKLDIQDDSINYISAADLKKYLEVANHFLSAETKEIVNWLIVNNASYIADLSNDKDENALAGFYKAGAPKSGPLKELYDAVAKVIKSGRFLEIPVFQTKAQFDSIISKKESPDAIILDLVSEKGRNKVARQYNPLVIKLCSQWNGKSNLSYDELMSAAYEGLTWAMNKFGKKTDKNKVDQETINSSQTFGQYAAYQIRIAILEAIKSESHTVRIPVSAQNKERKEKGYNTKTNTVSGNKSVSKDDEGGKTLFDFIGDVESVGNDLDREDLKKLEDEFYKILEAEFGKKIIDAFCSFNGIHGYEKMKNKDIAKKYGISNSAVTYYNLKVNIFIRQNKKLTKIFHEMIEIMRDLNESKDNYNVQLETPRTIKKPATNMFEGE